MALQPTARAAAPAPKNRYSRRSVSVFGSKKNTNSDPNAWNVDSVSDEDALLAVRAYLVRKQRLKWKTGEERKQRRQRYQASMADASSWQQPTTGFFWEDPNQLIYLTRRGRDNERRLWAGATGTNSSLNNDGDMDESLSLSVRTSPAARGTRNQPFDEYEEDEDDEDLAATALWESGQNPEETLDEWETIVNTPETVQQVRQLVHDDDDDENANEEIPDEEDDEFSAIDGAPSPSFVRRSIAAQRRWSDPVWKAQWYEKRWGRRKYVPTKQAPFSTQEKRRKPYQPLTFDIEDFLESSELAQLTPDEIALAIQIYTRSKERRRSSRQATLLQRQADIAWNSSGLVSSNNDPKVRDNQKEMASIERDSLFQQKPDELLARQKQRSERAKRAYQTRLKREQSGSIGQQKTITLRKQGPANSIAKASSSRTTSSPHMAIVQIQAALNAHQLPARSHVECLLLPHRLAQRKQVLLRILNECFGLRGKCVPVRFLLGARDKEDTVVANRLDDDDTSSGDDAEEEYVFVTHCPVHIIGDFVLYKLKELEAK